MREDMIERVRCEHRRLLYVALTRARDRLYISGFAGERELPDDCWSRLIDAGLASHLVDETDRNGQRIKRLQRKPYPTDAGASAMTPSATPIMMPDWLNARAPIEQPIMPPLKPSSAMDAADRSDRPVDLEFARLARRRGTLIHALLELLPDVPDARRAEIASAWLHARAKDLDEATRAKLVNDALTLIRSPDLADLFGASSRAEAPLVGLLKRDGRPPRNVSGQVDRLAVLDHEVIIADYKTAARTPDDVNAIPESYIAQLAAYRALIVTLYPGKTISCLLIYTAGPTVFEIDAARLDASLARIA
jgi:ATP-dependent helicase/nuclease subunit A